MLLDTPVCDFGWKAPDFMLRDPDGNSFRMSGHLQDRGLVIAFICNHCPYVKAVAERLSADARTLMKEGVNVLAVMSNNYQHVPEDGPSHMKRFAEKYDFPFPYLVDEDQTTGRNYGAVCTPDFFGLNKHGELQYRGRIDDAGMGDPGNRTPELVNAMRQIAETGQGPRHQTPSMGCSIKWK